MSVSESLHIEGIDRDDFELILDLVAEHEGDNRWHTRHVHPQDAPVQFTAYWDAGNRGWLYSEKWKVIPATVIAAFVLAESFRGRMTHAIEQDALDEGDMTHWSEQIFKARQDTSNTWLIDTLAEIDLAQEYFSLVLNDRTDEEGDAATIQDRDFRMGEIEQELGEEECQRITALTEAYIKRRGWERENVPCPQCGKPECSH